MVHIYLCTVLLAGIIVWGNGAAWRRSALSECFSSYNCSKLATSSVKIKILNSFGGCLKCAGFYHSTKDCMFRFCRPCSKFSKYHMEYLCKESKLLNSQSTTPKVTQECTQEVSSGIAVLPNVTADSALPTFTFCVSSHGKLYRRLRDTGSQNTFISSKLVNLLNFKVNLTSNGFNGSKEYSTSYVAVPVRIDSYTYSIVALVVPSINIKLPLPFLGQVVNILQNRQFVFADKLLNKDTELIDDVQLLLGTDF